ncbi:MotE family protein [Kordiimonas marina]|uniref:MotE family protein n=1 Tax=Kordiimonas marina TaxID=2872312 RepID=UPI001FF53FA3|nr:hypothetical protein [Kordiimonas marina]MCJ9430345.1 hypothetical protein [Kordiimonas marina]
MTAKESQEMKGSSLSKVRLFPLMMGVAFIALTLRGVSLYTGIALIVQPAQAEDSAAAQQGETDKAAAENKGDAAQDKQQTSEPVKPPLVVGLPSSQEMQLITQLRQRREELDKRAQKLDLQQELLAGTEKRINDKIDQLKKLEERIKAHLKLFEKREEEKLAQIVKVYETMKPKEAAPRFEALPIGTQVELATRMNSRKIAAIMGAMTPSKASELTLKLATMAQPPSIEEIQKEEKTAGGSTGRGK